MSSPSRMLLKRGGVLFVTGSLFSLPLNLLQIQRHFNLFPAFFQQDEVLNLSSWWTSVLCGVTAVIIGLMYPYLDELLSKSQQLQHCHHDQLNFYPDQLHSQQPYDKQHYTHNTPPHQAREWSSVMRCVAIFVGINHASAKIYFSNNLQLTLTLLILSLGLWYLFDGSKAGFLLTSSVAVLASLVTHLLVYHGLYSDSYPDSSYLRSWLPCLFFSGSITIGNIGRQLAQYDSIGCCNEHTHQSQPSTSHTKEHLD